MVINTLPSPSITDKNTKEALQKTPQTQKFCILVYYNLKNSQILEQKKKIIIWKIQILVQIWLKNKIDQLKPTNSMNVPKCHERWMEWRIGVGA